MPSKAFLDRLSVIEKEEAEKRLIEAGTSARKRIAIEQTLALHPWFLRLDNELGDESNKRHLPVELLQRVASFLHLTPGSKNRAEEGCYFPLHATGFRQQYSKDVATFADKAKGVTGTMFDEIATKRKKVLLKRAAREVRICMDDIVARMFELARNDMRKILEDIADAGERHIEGPDSFEALVNGDSGMSSWHRSDLELDSADEGHDLQSKIRDMVLAKSTTSRSSLNEGDALEVEEWALDEVLDDEEIMENILNNVKGDTFERTIENKVVFKYCVEIERYEEVFYNPDHPDGDYFWKMSIDKSVEWV